MQRSVPVVGSLVVALVVGIALTHWPPSAPPAPPAPEQAAPTLGTAASEAPPIAVSEAPLAPPLQELAALRAEVTLLRAHVSTVERWIRAQQRSTPEQPPGSAAAPPPAPRTDPASLAALNRERHQQMAVIDAGFRSEPADLRWATETEGIVQAAFASDDVIQNTLLNLECRAQTCRVVLADDDTGELAKALPLVLMQLGSTLPQATADIGSDGAGGKTVILYLTQAAPTLPPPGQ